jgi:hypothetical protein
MERGASPLSFLSRAKYNLLYLNGCYWGMLCWVPAKVVISFNDETQIFVSNGSNHAFTGMEDRFGATP